MIEYLQVKNNFFDNDCKLFLNSTCSSRDKFLYQGYNQDEKKEADVFSYHTVTRRLPSVVVFLLSCAG
uniref:Uncharacterized protein n=1 Tax=Arion vulgaris TaxID=1028688 RepID=A0A0B7BHC6_9EUPU